MGLVHGCLGGIWVGVEQCWIQGFTDDVAAVLKKDYPAASEQRLAAVSYGLISLYFNLDSLAPLGMNHIYRQPAREAAGYLLAVLKSSEDRA